MGLFITKRVLSKFYRFPVFDQKNRIHSFPGHHPYMCVWFKWNIHYMLLPQPLKGNRSVASFKGSSTVTERSSGDPINLFSEIIRGSNWLFNLHLHFSFQGVSLLALCPAMQKRSLAPRGCGQAGIQDNDEEVPSWWQCHTLTTGETSIFFRTRWGCFGTDSCDLIRL